MINLFTAKLYPTIALSALVLFAGCTPASQNEEDNSREERRVPVAVTEVQERTFEERISVQGNLLAKNYAMVSPMTDGTVTDVFVNEGDWVEANKTPLLQIDEEILTRAQEIAQQDRAVAASGRIDAEAQLAAAEAQYNKAKLDYERYKRLFNQQAITPDAMEQMEAGHVVAKAQLERAGTAVKLREQQETQAEAAFNIARRRLDDSLLVSPIDGWVSFRGIEPGEFAGAGIPVIRIADTRVLEVSAFLPGDYYPRLNPGETQVRVKVSGIDLGQLTVTYRSPEIQKTLRTFEIRCLVESPPEGVVPGAIAQVEAVLQTRTGPGVHNDVIQIRDGKDVVFVVEDNKARMVEIQAGISSDGWTEILGETLSTGAPFISRGYNLVNEGTAVSLQEEVQ